MQDHDLKGTKKGKSAGPCNASEIVAAANSRGYALIFINMHFRHIETKPSMKLYKHWSGLKLSIV